MIFGFSSVLVTDSVTSCTVLIALEFFCGAFIKPVLTGLMLNQVPPKLRPMANSVANFSYNLLGYLPAPIMYGFFYELGETPHNHWGFLSIQFFTAFVASGLTFIFLRNRYIVRKYAIRPDIEMVELNEEINNKVAMF